MLNTFGGRLIGAIALGTLVVAGTPLGALNGSAPRPRDDSPIWTEAAWNLPLDNWGQGRVWHTPAANGSSISLFARTKTGFCNCFNGIADDAEIERIGDVDLHGDNFKAAAPGHVTALGDLPGRERSFEASNRWTGTRHVLSIVAASDCKAVVATLVSGLAVAAAIEASAAALLTNETFRRWAANQ